jgi:uncharacterized protein (TIGR02246 family)
VTSPSPQPQAADDTVLEDFMHRWARAIVTNDVDQIAPFVTDDWLLIDTPGAVTRDAFHKVVASGVLRHTTMTHDVLDIRPLGPDVAILRTHGHNTAEFQGEPVEADEWTTNILVRRPDGWRCMLTQLTPRDRT